MRIITLAGADKLAQARVLARSLRRHQPDWGLEVVSMGARQVLGPPQDQPQAQLKTRSAAELLDLDLERLVGRHDEHELATLLLPRVLQAYTKLGSGPLLHLPPSVWVIGSLEPIAQALSARSVLLAPRTSTDVPDDGMKPTLVELERAGRIDETIIGVDGTRAAAAFLEWWGAHVEESIGSLVSGGVGARPEDRPWLARFLELAPARFQTAALEDPGFNLSLWNLHARQLGGSLDGVSVDGRWPARFLNLPGFEPDRPYRLSAEATRARVSRSPVLRELCLRYAAELDEAGWSDADHRREVGRRLANGLVYDDSMRSLYACARTLGERFEDPFSERGTAAFTAWLEGPSPEGAAHDINRYVFYRVARERPDVVRAFPQLDGSDGEQYVAWCRAFGREELAIPDRFMPAPPGPRPVLPSAANTHAVSQEPEQPDRHRPERDATAPAGQREPQQGALDGAPAVRLTGYLGHTLGLGAAARGYVQALTAADVPVTTVSVPLHHLELPQALAARYGRHGYDDLLQEGRHGFEIVAVNADELPALVERLGEDYFEGPRIGIWGWETTTVPDRWQKAFALIDEIWVYSRFMATNIGAVASVPVTALPPPVESKISSREPLRLGVPAGFLFLFVFDYLSTIQRKNPVGLIEAFSRAFAPGEGPQLLIKTINGPLRPLAEEEVLWAAHGRKDIHVMDTSLESEELQRLMAGCDCYVSLHRAEGFGLTLAEAMALGKPVIATGYSGNVDFMTRANSYLVDYTIGRVGPECEIYPPEGEWAEPSVEHAARLMRRVLEEPEEAARVGARAARDIASTLSAAATGTAMRVRLEQLAARTPDGLAAGVRRQAARPRAPRPA